MTAMRARTQMAAELGPTVRRLHRNLRLRAASGPTPSQSSIIATLAAAGPLRLGELAGREAVTPPTASKAVERLIELGLVRRQPDVDDARAHILTVPDRRAAERGDDAASRLLTDALAQRSETEHRALRHALPVLQSIIDDLRA